MSNKKQEAVKTAQELLVARSKKAAGIGHNKQFTDPKHVKALLEILKHKQQIFELNEAIKLIVAGEKDRGYPAPATRGTIEFLLKDNSAAQEKLQDQMRSLLAANAPLPLFAYKYAEDIFAGVQKDLEDAVGNAEEHEEELEEVSLDDDAPKGKKKVKGKAKPKGKKPLLPVSDDTEDDSLESSAARVASVQ